MALFSEEDDRGFAQTRGADDLFFGDDYQLVAPSDVHVATEVEHDEIEHEVAFAVAPTAWSLTAPSSLRSLRPNSSLLRRLHSPLSRKRRRCRLRISPSPTPSWKTSRRRRLPMPTQSQNVLFSQAPI